MIAGGTNQLASVSWETRNGLATATDAELEDLKNLVMQQLVPLLTGGSAGGQQQQPIAFPGGFGAGSFDEMIINQIQGLPPRHFMAMMRSITQTLPLDTMRDRIAAQFPGIDPETGENLFQQITAMYQFLNS